jgi:hypothetical protein
MLRVMVLTVTLRYELLSTINHSDITVSTIIASELTSQLNDHR